MTIIDQGFKDMSEITLAEIDEALRKRVPRVHVIVIEPLRPLTDEENKRLL